MNIKSLSKHKASKYRPEQPTLMISIQDGEKQELPFKQRTNHITRSHAVALFAAKYFAKDEELYQKLLHQEGRFFGGNAFVYNKLVENYQKIWYT